MNTDRKILNEILANLIEYRIQRIIYQHHMGFIPGM